MAREQLGICAEANLHGSYLLLNVLEGQEQALRQKLARLPQLFDYLAGHFSEAMLTGVVAVGCNFWDLLYPGKRPLGLQAFPEVAPDTISLAQAPIDLLIQIRSDRLDANVIACKQVLQLLTGHIEVQDQLQGFRFLDGRSLTGFIDSPYNANARHKRQAALVHAELQPAFSAGSYVCLQQLCFNLAAWQLLSQADQEEIMGYEKVSTKPLPAEILLPDSHYAVMAQPAETVLMQNMPFYQLKRQGLIQLSYAASAEALVNQLQRRLGLVDGSAGADLLLNYYHIELTAAFFAPSISFLELSANN